MKNIESPCINVCTQDEKGMCLGCKRTMDEIAKWMFYSDEERQKILAELPNR